jgi:predicted PurR-regulated permease PerM
MGSIVVTVVAIAIALVLAVVVAIMRLMTAVQGLHGAVKNTQQWLQPVLDELDEAGQIVSLELAQLQANVADLTAQRQSGAQPRSDEGDGYTA